MAQDIDIFNYDIETSQLPALTADVIHSMGYIESSPDHNFLPIVYDLLEKAYSQMTISGGFRVLENSPIQVFPDYFQFSDLRFECGKIIAARLRKIEKLAIFTTTLGMEFDSWIKELFESGDPLSGYIGDLIGSHAAEAATDNVEEQIMAYAKNQYGFTCTNRYSPGYCDWDVNEQHKLFDLLPDKFCGITLTESALMKPIKSVSGIIGMGPDAKKIEYTCKVCSQHNCFMRPKHDDKNQPVIA